MKRNAYADGTIKETIKRMKTLQENCNFNEPEEVKLYIANKQCSNSYKNTLLGTYNHYMKSIGQEWNKPFYKRYHKLPKIPSEEKIDLLIANGSPRMTLMLSMSKDMGTRPIELTWLKLSDINLQNGTVNITGAKHTMGRIGKLKPQTLDILKQYVNNRNIGINDRILPTTSTQISHNYRRMRNKLAQKLQDPSIRTIRLYDFRHYFATMLYHKTKDLLYVKAKLGHKNIETTMLYTQLIESLANDDYHCKTATNVKEATNLTENGFEYTATTPDGYMLFRKRK